MGVGQKFRMSAQQIKSYSNSTGNNAQAAATSTPTSANQRLHSHTQPHTISRTSAYNIGAQHASIRLPLN